MSEALDPVAAEIHRRALQNVVDEMALTLVRTSGSPAAVDTKDFSTCLLDTIPEQLAFSSYVVFHAASSMAGTQVIASRLREGIEGDLRPGDGWLANDPHESGQMHQGDCSIIMPIFSGDEHVAWAFSNMHMTDVGGGGLSGFAPGAKTMYEEALRFPAVRIIRDGRIDPAWAQFIAANVRLPAPVLNDIRSMIAANNVAARKLTSIIDRFGPERHREYSEAAKDLTEQALRRRVEQLPDGVYRATEWIECEPVAGGPTELLELPCELEIAGSELRFRFSGPPQVESLINSTPSTMMGNAMTTIAIVLGYGDLPFNAGMWRPLSFDLGPPGTVVNAVPPAPVSLAHGGVSARIHRGVKTMLCQAMSLSDDPVLRSRVSPHAAEAACWSSFYGLNQHGHPSVMFEVDSVIGMGGPAQTTMDGLDTYGSTQTSGCGLSDVETHEASEPVLFLWRRVAPDSAGAGQFRGGNGLEQAYELRYTDRMAGFMFGGVAEPPTRGFGGGHLRGAADLEYLAGANVDAVLASGRLPVPSRVEGELRHVKGRIPSHVLERGDVLRFISGGGGGLGDPLLRDPDDVASDVQDGYLTAPHAAAAYGVVLGADGAVDHERTAARRAEILVLRIGEQPREALRAPADVGIAVVLTGTGDARAWTCGHCATVLCPATEDWQRSGAVTREHPITERLEQLGVLGHDTVHAPHVLVREHYCPACAAALAIEALVEGSSGSRAPELSGVGIGQHDDEGMSS